MEVLFETHPEIFWRSGSIHTVQHQARIDPDPVLVGDTDADGGGVSIYGSVIHDGGQYRMWYQAAPRDWGEANMSFVCYAESDDGREWRKPDLNIVDYGKGPNNLRNLSVAVPSVFIDPDAPASQRYRATGCIQPDVEGAHAGVKETGYYTLHSSDGLHWEADTDRPVWDSLDVITSAYHPGQRRGIVAMKFNPVLRGFHRRVIHMAEWKDGEWSGATPALIPDEYDDMCAVARGFDSGDYYGTGLLPAGRGTVAMIWQFRHRLPRDGAVGCGMYGVVDISLAYQREPRACWEHQEGRPDFVSASDQPWSKGGIYSASSPVEVGDEHWLYVSGTPVEHAYSINNDGESDPDLLAERSTIGASKIGVARFPKFRLFGFRAHPTGSLCLNPRLPDVPWAFSLNYACELDGYVDIALHHRETGEAAGSAARLTGDEAAAVLAWDEDATKAIANGGEFNVQLNMRHATVYAFEVTPAG